MSDLAKRVEAVLRDCLYTDEELPPGQEPPADSKKVYGLVTNFAFHPERLKAHRDDIARMCNELPEEFQISKGGGWSFLNLCMTRSGEQWGEHTNCEQLLVLAIGTDQGGYLFPRMMWESLPGSMPYVYFNTIRGEGNEALG